MTKEEFEVAKNEVITMIDTLNLRGEKVSSIYELLSQIDSLPKMKTWEALDKFISEKQFSDIEKVLLTQIHSLLKDKVISNLLFNHKLIKIIEVNEETFDNLLNYFQRKFTKLISDFSIHQMIIAKAFANVKFKYDINSQLESYISKSIVEDDLKINIENRVSKKLQKEFKDIYGIKKINFHTLNHVVFDKRNKVIYLAVDLAGIIKTTSIQQNIDKFSISVKGSVKGLTYPNHSRNLFAKIRDFYNNESYPASYVVKLFYKTPDGMTYTSNSNQNFPDARDSTYHKFGEQGIHGKLSIYRILKGFNTKRQTTYTIELASIPAMTTKPDPVLFEATVKATNKEDFAEALQKLL